ncbi:signal recognition particle subunit SRP54 [Bartonella sp. AR 15-3]|nr:signal recognition particle subunit SRP54 [Bartonella sp. AR 15-3]
MKAPGAIPDLSGLDSIQFSKLQKQIEKGHLGSGLPGLPERGLTFPGLLNDLSKGKERKSPFSKKK